MLKVEPVRELESHQGARISLIGELEAVKISVQLDIGFGDYICPLPERQPFPDLLPDMPTANILMYPPETVIAEKFEAMIRFGEVNSWVKGFHDIWVTSRTFPFDLPTLV